VQRRPQLVRGVGDELGPGPVERGKPEPHPFERTRELAELVEGRVDTASSNCPPAIRSAAASSRLIRRAWTAARL